MCTYRSLVIRRYTVLAIEMDKISVGPMVPVYLYYNDEKYSAYEIDRLKQEFCFLPPQHEAPVRRCHTYERFETDGRTGNAKLLLKRANKVASKYNFIRTFVSLNKLTNKKVGT